MGPSCALPARSGAGEARFSTDFGFISRTSIFLLVVNTNMDTILDKKKPSARYSDISTLPRLFHRDQAEIVSCIKASSVKGYRRKGNPNQLYKVSDVAAALVRNRRQA